MPGGRCQFENCVFWFGSAARIIFAPFVAGQKRPLTWLRGVELQILFLALALSQKGPDKTRAVGKLAERLGVGERQLRRLFLQHLGASPISVAQTRRVLSPQLIHDTRLPMAEIAVAAGFGACDASTKIPQLVSSASQRLAQKNVAPGRKDVALGYATDLHEWDCMLSFTLARHCRR